MEWIKRRVITGELVKRTALRGAENLVCSDGGEIFPEGTGDCFERRVIDPVIARKLNRKRAATGVMLTPGCQGELLSS